MHFFVTLVVLSQNLSRAIHQPVTQQIHSSFKHTLAKRFCHAYILFMRVVFFGFDVQPMLHVRYSCCHIIIIVIVVLLLLLQLANMYNCHHLTQPFRRVDIEMGKKLLGHNTTSEKRPKIFYSNLNL